MSMITKTLSAGLVGLLLGAAALVTAGPALAGGGHHGGFGHHHGWGHRHHGWGYGYVDYAPAYYGGCHLKRFVTIYGEVVFKKVCF
jgi:hypothetical protein